MRVAASVLVSVLASATAWAVADRLVCSPLKDPLRLTGSVDLETAAGSGNCKLSGAVLFCAPGIARNAVGINKTTGEQIALSSVSGAPTDYRVCYKVKCKRPGSSQVISDEFGSRTIRHFRTSLLCTPAFPNLGSLRFVDNGDGTVTDRQTGLQWEQKTRDGSIHDVNATFTWSSVSAGFGFPADGTVFTQFLRSLNDCRTLDGLNVSGGFAGHCDWRLPTITELQTLALEPGACRGAACVDRSLEPILATDYYSSTPGPGIWTMCFNPGCGGRTRASPTVTLPVRAVRGARIDGLP